MNKVISFFICILPFCASAQMELIEGLSFAGSTYDIVIIKATQNNLSKFSIFENSSKAKHSEVIQSLSYDLSHFAINAGSVNADCSPVGLLIDNYSLKTNLNVANGDGNFFLKPNGAMIISRDDVFITETSEVSIDAQVRIAVQSGPMLIIDGQVHTAFNPSSVNKYIRAGVGVYTDRKGLKFIVFAVSKEPVSFFEFSGLFLNKYNCRNALCLESAGVVMNMPYLSQIADDKDLAICRYLIYKD